MRKKKESNERAKQPVYSRKAVRMLDDQTEIHDTKIFFIELLL
jgi:hypothetical protein